MSGRMVSGFPIGVLLAAFLGATGAAAQTPDQPVLGLPIECKLGDDCWLVNLVDRIPGEGFRDYLCGRHGYDEHKGVDIGIRDWHAMDRGVAVLAAAAGVVTGLRDGMVDGVPSAEFRRTQRRRYCGNGVVLRHAGGWQTQYCHLRRGSVAVSKGDKVARGAKLGLVGHSGMAEFPHIHLTVRFQGKVIDPFVGLTPGKDCRAGPAPLWSSAARSALSRPLTAIYNAGFAPTRPKVSAIRKGLYRAQVLSRRIPALVFWAEMFWVMPGDRVKMVISGPDGRTVAEHGNVLPKRQARRMIFAGRKKIGLFWTAGTYTGTMTLERTTADGKKTQFSVSRRVQLRD